MAMPNPLTLKLSSFADLSAEDRLALERLCASPIHRKAGQVLVREGDRPKEVFLLLEGWAYRYTDTDEGKRQILAYLIPGDLCDPHVFLLDRMDHSISLLSDARFAAIPERAMMEAVERPAIARALWWSTLVDEAVARRWLVNVGQRNAHARLAHLFCELWLRLHQVGLTRGNEFDLPLTQEQLGETVGLTSVHVNRTLQHMRSEGLISLHARKISILDSEGMKRIAGFDPKYLHMERHG